MAMEAVGGYIRELRDAVGLTQKEAAVQSSITSKTISRWENGKNEPALTKMEPLIQFLKGSMDHVQQLLSDKTATFDDGMSLAQRWVRERALEKFEASAHTMTPVELKAAIAEFEAEVNYDEDILAAWRAFVAAWRKARPRNADARRQRGYRNVRRRPPNDA